MYEVVITNMETGKRQVYKSEIVLCVTLKDAGPFGELLDGTINGPITLKNAGKLWKRFYKQEKQDEKKE